VKKCQTEFKDNSKIIQCPINQCHYVDQTTAEEDTRNVVIQTWCVTEACILRLVDIPAEAPISICLPVHLYTQPVGTGERRQALQSPCSPSYQQNETKIAIKMVLCNMGE
jgi:hypothetical protein